MKKDVTQPLLLKVGNCIILHRKCREKVTNTSYSTRYCNLH